MKWPHAPLILTLVLMVVGTGIMGCGEARNVQTDNLAESPDKAYEKTLVVLQQLGWTIVSTDKEAGRVSAEKAEGRRSKLQVWINVTPKAPGSEIQVTVTKPGRRSRRKVRKAAEQIMERLLR